jgi:hypothetical protein
VQLPHVEKLFHELKDKGFLVVGLTSSYDSIPKVKRWVEHAGIDSPFLIDTADYKDSVNSVFKRYHAYAGKQYFIDGDGKIFAVYSKIGLTIPRVRDVLSKMGVKVKPEPKATFD